MPMKRLKHFTSNPRKKIKKLRPSHYGVKGTLLCGNNEEMMCKSGSFFNELTRGCSKTTLPLNFIGKNGTYWCAKIEKPISQISLEHARTPFIFEAHLTHC